MGAKAEQLAEHWNAMVRTAHGVLGSREEAEECAGQALLQVCEQNIANVTNLEAHMVTVAKRRAIDRRRHLERCRRRDLLLAGQERLESHDIADDVARQHEAVWMANEAQRLLDHRSLDALTRYAEGEHMPAIAAAHGLTEGATRTVLHRARKLLREVYTKGLAIFGLGWLLGRRPSRGTSAVAGLGTASLAAAVLPFAMSPVAPDHTVKPEATLVLLPAEVVAEQQTTKITAVAGASAQPQRTQAVSPSTPKSAKKNQVIIRGPGRATTRIETEHRGDEEYSDPVTIVLDCLAHFRHDPEQIGC